MNQKLLKNQVKSNKFIGIMFRGGSKGQYENNNIENNPTQCCYTYSWKDLIDLQKEKIKLMVEMIVKLDVIFF